MSFTSCREMDNPRPVPPNRRVDELSACWKGTNNISTSDCDIPIPVLDQMVRLEYEKFEIMPTYSLWTVEHTVGDSGKEVTHCIVNLRVMS